MYYVLSKRLFTRPDMDNGFALKREAKGQILYLKGLRLLRIDEKYKTYIQFYNNIFKFESVMVHLLETNHFDL